MFILLLQVMQRLLQVLQVQQVPKQVFLYIGLIMEKLLIGGIYLRQRVDIMQFLMDHLTGVVEKYQAAVKHMLDH